MSTPIKTVSFSIGETLYGIIIPKDNQFTIVKHVIKESKKMVYKGDEVIAIFLSNDFIIVTAKDGAVYNADKNLHCRITYIENVMVLQNRFQIDKNGELVNRRSGMEHFVFLYKEELKSVVDKISKSIQTKNSKEIQKYQSYINRTLANNKSIRDYTEDVLKKLDDE